MTRQSDAFTGFSIVAHSLGTHSVNEVAWSPDGSKLALALSDEYACPWYCDSAVGIANTDGTHFKVLDRARTCFGSSCAAQESYIVGAPQWIDNGSRVAYTIAGGECYQYYPIPCAHNVVIASPSNGRIELLLTAAGFPSWRD